ncbi:MAG: 6-carboxytetrahydropterin synthase [Deltaproteobacteria bacterium]|nr:6-carboxytetrahydropterin synthase [Deltaproteobacteria bacterium]MBI3295369.1 6-carboxytetrahydropterin synthase [Deltaproteobacteria bacterium]
MRHELTVNTTLTATHSLSEREQPHAHIWKVRVCVTGELESGRVLSLPEMKRWLDGILAPLQNTFLNEQPILDEDSRQEPTCENMSRFLFEKMSGALELMPSLAARRVLVAWVQVAVIEHDGSELGNVRFFPD